MRGVVCDFVDVCCCAIVLSLSCLRLCVVLKCVCAFCVWFIVRNSVLCGFRVSLM